MKALHLDPIWLRERYERDGLSTYAIAKIVGRDPKRIYEKLVDFGIATRARGANLKYSGTDNFIVHHKGDPWTGRQHSLESKHLLSVAASRPRPHLQGSNNGMYGRTGALNPNWKGGISPERQRLYSLPTVREFIEEIYERDAFTCQCCGTAKKGARSLHAHHRKGWEEYPDLRFVASNLVTVCRKCHEWIHSDANTEREFL